MATQNNTKTGLLAQIAQVDANGTLTGLNVSSLANGIITGNTSNISGNLTVGGNAVITGNLEVQGTTTTINSNVVTIDDVAITLANNATSPSQANGGGFIINGANANFLYNSTSNVFLSSHGIIAPTMSPGTLTANSVNTGNITANSTVTLGAVGNVNISGGSNGQFLTTNGNGNLSWQTQQYGFTLEGFWYNSVTVGGVGVANTFTVTGNAAPQIAINDAFYFSRDNSQYEFVVTNVQPGVPSAGFTTVSLDTNWTTAGYTPSIGDNLVYNVSESVANVYAGPGITMTYNPDPAAKTLEISAAAGTTVGGANGQLQYNANGIFGGVTGASYANSILTLGAVANVSITGGSNGQVLSTNGNGILSWANAVGGSNTQVQFNSNGVPGGSANLTFVDGAAANLTLRNLTLSSTTQAANITNTNQLNIKVSGSNGGGIDLIGAESVNNPAVPGGGISIYGGAGSGTTVQGGGITLEAGNGSDGTVAGGDVYIAAGSAANGTPGSVELAAGVNNAGNRGNITFTGNTQLGAVANVHITGGSNGQFLSTNGNGTLSWANATTTPAGSNTSVQFNNNGSFDGSTNLTFNDAASTLTINDTESGVTTSLRISTTSGGGLDPNEVRLNADNTSDLYIGQEDNTTGSGPNVRIYGGIAKVNGGNLNLVGGDLSYAATGDTGAGGSVNIEGGTSGVQTNGQAGNVNLVGGSALGTNAIGGSVNITAATAPRPGEINLQAGDGTGSANAGGINLYAGAGNGGGNGGEVYLGGGTATTTGIGGNVELQSGSGFDGPSAGNVVISGGQAVGTGAGNGGSVILQGGGSQGGTPGSVILQTQGSTAGGGNVVIAPGNASSQSGTFGGSINFTAGGGGAYGGGGSINFTGGSGGSDFGANLAGPGGNITLLGGGANGTQFNAGSIIIAGGGNTSGQAGNVNISAGSGGTNGQINFSGRTNLGAVGNVKITGGSSGQAIVTDGAGNLSFKNTTFGQFYSNAIQTTTANAATAMTFNNTDISSNVSIVSGSQITINSAGTFNLQFSAQVDRTTNGTDIVYIWLAKNGANVPWSSTSVTISGTAAQNPEVAAWNWLVQSDGNDYFQIYWASSNGNVELQSNAAPAIGPAIPSVIATVIPVGV